MKTPIQRWPDHHLKTNTSFYDINPGSVLVKIKLVSDYEIYDQEKNHPRITLHGFIDQENKIYITDEIIETEEIK